MKNIGPFTRNLIVMIVTLLLVYGCASDPEKPIKYGSMASDFNAKQITKIAVICEDGTADKKDGKNSPTLFWGSKDEKDVKPPLRLIEDTIFQYLLDKGYKVAARSDVKSILQEISFQSSGLTDTDATRIGKLLNVPAVMIVTATSSTKRHHNANYYARTQAYDTYDCSLGARLLDVQSGEILWTTSANSRNKGLGFTNIFSGGSRGSCDDCFDSIAKIVGKDIPPRQ